MPSGEEINNKMVNAASEQRTSNNSVRHQYRILNDEEKAQMILIKDMGLALLTTIDKLGSQREYSIAKTKVEEAVMWAVKGITG